ncbi:hypothetical protein ACF0H5_018972 [Mactra antiquata]
MFCNPVKERDEKVVQMHDVAPDTIQTVIGYMYTGNVILTNENAQDILMAATMLELTHLIEQCANYMIREVCLDNCMEMFLFASHFACLKLKLHCRKFILDHFSDLIKDDKFYDIGAEDLEDVISCDDISVENEETVLEVIKKWVEFGKSRDEYFPRLFRHVRLPLLNEEYCKTITAADSLINNNSECMTRLREFSIFKEKVFLKQTGADVDLDRYNVNTTPRYGMFNRAMLVFSGGTVEEGCRSLTTFDPLTFKNFTGVQPHPTFDFKFKIDFYQLVSANGQLFIFGGIHYDDHHFADHGKALAEAYCYNMKCNVWDRVQDMVHPRCCFSATPLNEKIIVIGGKSVYPRGPPLENVEFYDVFNDVWNALAPVPISIYNHAASATHNAVFVFGGRDEDDDYLDTVLRYDIQTDSWSLVTTQMNKPRAQFSAFTYRSLIYLIGGVTLHENILSVAVYDPQNNTWSSGKTFPEERKITSAAFHDGTIFVCGGIRHMGVRGRPNRTVESRDLFKYDIVNNTWSKVVKLVQYGNINSVTCVVLNTKYLQESDYISCL